MSASIERLAVAALVACLCTPAAAEQPRAKPTLSVAEKRWLTLTGLPPVLDNREVESELETGLTATFVFVVDLEGVSDGKTAGGARVGVRYELWDEVFHVSTYTLEGPQKEIVDSREDLRVWWQKLELRVADLSEGERAGARRAQVRLDVVPFSQSEQIDTQRWFAESVRRAEAAASQGDASVVVDSEGGDSVFSLLIATSIRSRPLRSYRWTLDLPARPQP